MTQQRRTNLLGWIVFGISLIVYILTLEPTASFWDCTEFIACAGKLEIGHAPGAPLFMLLGRFFALFAGNDVTKVAYMINLLSATASAATIMFLFWTILWFGRKISKTLENEIAVMDPEFAKSNRKATIVTTLPVDKTNFEH